MLRKSSKLTFKWKHQVSACRRILWEVEQNADPMEMLVMQESINAAQRHVLPLDDITVSRQDATNRSQKAQASIDT